jgi:ABC-type transport system substrate-binding protein
VDQLLDQAATEPSPDRRLRLYNQAEQLIIDDAAWVPLAYTAQHTLKRDHVQGVQFTPRGLLYYYPVKIVAH